MTQIIDGYTMKSTFYSDFAIADNFGIEGVKDTYNRAFNEWKGNAVFVAELVLTLNHRGWKHFQEGRKVFAILYFDLYNELNDWAWENLEGKDLEVYWEITD